MKFYPLAEHMDYRLSMRFKIPVDSIKAIKSGEFRKPKKGEYFLSGSEVMAYLAFNDLDWDYHIAKIVQIKPITTIKIVKEIK